jgi:hypothetical protein
MPSVFSKRSEQDYYSQMFRRGEYDEESKKRNKLILRDLRVPVEVLEVNLSSHFLAARENTYAFSCHCPLSAW